MNKADEFRVTFDQNPVMKEIVTKLKPGEKVELEVHSTLKASDAEGADFIAEAYVPEGYELDEDAAPEGAMGSMSQSEPSMTPAAMMVRRKQGPPVAA